MREPLRAKISRWFRREDFLRDVREEYDRVAREYRRAMAHLEERQDAQQNQEVAEGLRRAALRLETSFRETKELETELRDWEARTGEPGDRNTDHPDVRAEILRSELALRQDRGIVMAIPEDQSPFRIVETTELFEDTTENRDDASDPLEDLEPALYPDAEHLLLTIRQTSKDIEGWHEQAEIPAEACDDVRQLRELHAALRQIDREEGTSRDRVCYALRMR